jgi:hypothetical protein
VISGSTHSISVDLAFKRLGTEVRAALEGELDALAQTVARRMKENAPKFRSTLTNSVHVDKTASLAREIAPGVAYAQYVEDGIKPGGKGLPRFFDPKSKSIVDWLESKPHSATVGPARLKKKRRPRVGSKARGAVEELLRDRYEGLAWHVRKHGIKAQPFVKKTHDEMEPLVRPRLQAAVQAAMTAVAANRAGGAA